MTGNQQINILQDFRQLFQPL